LLRILWGRLTRIPREYVLKHKIEGYVNMVSRNLRRITNLLLAACAECIDHYRGLFISRGKAIEYST